MDAPSNELPVLHLALAGFTAAEQACIESAAPYAKDTLTWRVSRLSDADALFINGRGAIPWQGGGVMVQPGSPGASPVCIDPVEWRRPMAFSSPIAIPGVREADTFDLRKPQSIAAVLRRFSGWLRPMAIQYWIASRIVRERLDLSGTTYHVTVDGRLQAVVSRRNGVGVLPISDPSLLDQAVWARRPGPADEIPGHFVQTGLTEVLWRYAMRTPRDLLPSYFRSGPIYWCRAPQLPQRLFRDSHLVIVRELAHAPTSFAELGRRTGLADAVLARDLAALRLAGAVSHDRKQALRSAGQPAEKSARQAPMDKTAPAPLTPQGA